MDSQMRGIFLFCLVFCFLYFFILKLASIILKLYLLYMIDFGQLMSLSVLKIILSALWPWLYFLSNSDTLNDVYDFLYDFRRHLHVFFFLIRYMHVIIFLPSFGPSGTFGNFCLNLLFEWLLGHVDDRLDM